MVSQPEWSVGDVAKTCHTGAETFTIVKFVEISVQAGGDKCQLVAGVMLSAVSRAHKIGPMKVSDLTAAR